jgi:hypothetical protein
MHGPSFFARDPVAGEEPPERRNAGADPVSGQHRARFVAIGRILDLYSPTECANFFANCGYDAD